MNQPLLKVQDVSYTYHTKAGETPALSHISFSVFPGEFVAIVGPSGCGKSTFLDMLCGLLKPSGGELLLNENRWQSLQPTLATCCKKTISLNGVPFTVTCF